MSFHNGILLFFNIGGGEFFIIFIVILLLFGAKKIPAFSKELAKGIKMFKETSENIKQDIKNEVQEIKDNLDSEK